MSHREDRSQDIRKNALNTKRYISKHGHAPEFFGKSGQPYIEPVGSKTTSNVSLEFPKEFLSDLVMSNLNAQLSNKQSLNQKSQTTNNSSRTSTGSNQSVN